MPVTSDKTLSALAELKQSHDNLSWLQKLFYSSAVSAALIEYDTENPTEESVKAIYEAYNNKTWFFQRSPFQPRSATLVINYKKS